MSDTHPTYTQLYISCCPDNCFSFILCLQQTLSEVGRVTKICTQVKELIEIITQVEVKVIVLIITWVRVKKYPINKRKEIKEIKEKKIDKLKCHLFVSS